MGTRTRRGVVVTSLCVVTWLLLPAGAALAQEDDAAGADLTGCIGSAVSTDDEGNPVDEVAAPGPPGSSQDHPFVVDYDGEVAYEGSSESVITDHSWDVKIFGAPVKSGGSANEDGETENSDIIKVSDYLPFKVTGLYYVSGGLSGDGGSCDGNMWVKLEGSPIGTIGWFIGLAFTLLGLFLVLTSLPTVLTAGPAAAAAPPASDEAPPPPPEDE